MRPVGRGLDGAKRSACGSLLAYRELCLCDQDVYCSEASLQQKSLDLWHFLLQKELQSHLQMLQDNVLYRSDHSQNVMQIGSCINVTLTANAFCY